MLLNRIMKIFGGVSPKIDAPDNEADFPDFYERVYDFTTIEGIEAIPDKPEYERFDMGIHSYIEYALRKRATVYDKNGEQDLAIACLRKANRIMPNSSMLWVENDYMRLPRMLKKYGRFDEARVEVEKITGKVMNIDKLAVEATRKQIDDVKQIGDLLCLKIEGACCEKCARWRSRVFSISGTDKRFPKFPKQLYDNGGIHGNHNRCCFISIVCYDTFFGSLTGFKNDKEALKSTYRPWVDDRTDEEKAMFEQCKKEHEEWQRHNDDVERDRDIYYTLFHQYPDIMPKSFTGFRRMKNAQTKNYLRLVEVLKGHGVEM